MARGINRIHVMTGFAAVGAALALLSTPVGLIELAVTSTGLSESLPAAAPPLGLTARLLLALFAALMAAGVTLAFHKTNNGGGSAAQGDKIMGFAMPRLSALVRGRRETAEGLPMLRRADAHPDAPARRPIFASEDFRGVAFFGPPGEAAIDAPTHEPTFFAGEEARDPIIERGDLTLPRAPEPLPDAEIILLARPRIALAEPQRVEAEAEPAAVPATPAPVGDSTVADLAARFERGLARRIALREAAMAAERAESALARTGGAADQPVLADLPAAQPVPVRADVDSEIDEALRAALGTLHRMTARAG